MQFMPNTPPTERRAARRTSIQLETVLLDLRQQRGSGHVHWLPPMTQVDLWTHVPAAAYCPLLRSASRDCPLDRTQRLFERYRYPRQYAVLRSKRRRLLPYSVLFRRTSRRRAPATRDDSSIFTPYYAFCMRFLTQLYALPTPSRYFVSRFCRHRLICLGFALSDDGSVTLTAQQDTSAAPDLSTCTTVSYLCSF